MLQLIMVNLGMKGMEKEIIWCSVYFYERNDDGKEVGWVNEERKWGNIYIQERRWSNIYCVMLANVTKI
jgi:hypothetical protein